VKRRSFAAPWLAACALLGGSVVAQGNQGKYAWAVAALPSGAEFKLEIADDPRSRWMGYRHRERVPPDEGMLFIFPREELLSFEMRDCLVSLDMIFLDSDFRVVEIAHDQQPCREGEPCPPVTPMSQARYVLEIAGGIARREGLEPGDRVTVLAEPPIP
jgi:uncharacterized membrane protein (UPF0127 family)